MITEDYVSFETAKLLKEKGFDWDESPFYSEQDRDEWRQNNNYTIPNTSYNPDLPFDSETITLIAPHVSLQMAMKWLREVHKIFIAISFQYDKFHQPYYFYKIANIGKKEDWNIEKSEHITVEKACEAAIKYCVENLTQICIELHQFIHIIMDAFQ